MLESRKAVHVAGRQVRCGAKSQDRSQGVAEVVVSQGGQEPLQELCKVFQDAFCSKHTCHIRPRNCRGGRLLDRVWAPGPPMN